MNYHWYDFIGNVGVVLTLLAYLLLQLHKISNHSMLFIGMNIIGSVFLIISLCYDFNLSAFLIEVCWFFISMIGVIRFFIDRRAHI